MKWVFPPNLKGLKRFHKIAERSKGKNIKGFSCDEIEIPSRDEGRSIRVRTYSSAVDRDCPGILYLHGGGYAINLPESDHHTIKKFLETRECIVVAPDYRRSLQKPFPAALNDSFDTLYWMAKNNEKLGFRKDQLFIAGGSAGGGLTLAITLLAQNKIPIAHIFPLYPMIDCRMETESMKGNNAPVWSENHNRLAWDLYLKGVKEINEYASPALAKDLGVFPPATTFVGELDPFRDETIDFFERLSQAGIESEYRIFKRAYHGFEIVNPRAKVSKQADRFLKDEFSKAVDNSFTGNKN